jgi:hypothetical protein
MNNQTVAEIGTFARTERRIQAVKNLENAELFGDAKNGS